MESVNTGRKRSKLSREGLPWKDLLKKIGETLDVKFGSGIISLVKEYMGKVSSKKPDGMSKEEKEEAYSKVLAKIMEDAKGDGKKKLKEKLEKLNKEAYAKMQSSRKAGKGKKKKEEKSESD